MASIKLTDPLDQLQMDVHNRKLREIAAVTYWGKEITRLRKLGTASASERADKVQRGKVDKSLARIEELDAQFQALVTLRRQATPPARSGQEPTGTRHNPHWANND